MELEAHAHKKGSLAYSTLLLASVLVLLASYLALYSSSLRSVIASAGSLESATYESDQAAYALLALARQGAANATYSNGNVTIISNSSRLIAYSSGASQFSSFASGYAPVGNLTINTTEASRPKMYIRPQNISLDYGAGAIAFTPQNAAYSAGNVTGYDISLIVGQNAPSLTWANISEVSQSSPDALYIHVAIQGANGVANDSRHLNRSANSTLLARDSNNNTLLQFAFSPTAAMRLNYATPIWTRSVVLLNPIYSNNTRVELGTNIIYLRLDDGTAENRQVYFDES